MAVNAGIGFHTLQELERFFRLLGFVALVVLPQNLIRVRIHYDRLHCCRTHVKSDEKLCIVVVRLLRPRANRFCIDSRNLNQHWTLMAVMIVHLPSQENSQILNRKRSQSSQETLRDLRGCSLCPLRLRAFSPLTSPAPLHPSLLWSVCGTAYL